MPSSASLHTLELRVPPVVLVLNLAICMWLVAEWFPAFAVAFQWSTATALVFVSLGAGVALAGVVAFRRAGTTVNPTAPEASSAMVATGIYRRSRNPMYLGFLLILAGWSLYLSHLLAALFLPVFVLYMNRFQIAPEEKALSAKFGAQYEQYVRQVRRWL